MYVSHLLYPFLCWCTFRLLICLGFYKQHCIEHMSACVILNCDFLQIMPRDGVAGLCDSSFFSFLRNFYTVLHSGCTNLHFQQLCRWAPFSPHPLQHVSFVEFLMLFILTGMGWYFTVVFISFIHRWKTKIDPSPKEIHRWTKSTWKYVQHH